MQSVPYTRAYIRQKGSTFVDLTLTGDMLDDLDLLTHRKGSVTVGFERGSFENDKAEGNARKRPFLGITQRELNVLIREVKDGRPEES